MHQPRPALHRGSRGNGGCALAAATEQRQHVESLAMRGASVCTCVHWARMQGQAAICGLTSSVRYTCLVARLKAPAQTGNRRGARRPALLAECSISGIQTALQCTRVCMLRVQAAPVPHNMHTHSLTKRACMLSARPPRGPPAPPAAPASGSASQRWGSGGCPPPKAHAPVLVHAHARRGA